MLIPLATGRAQQNIGRPIREPMVMRTCHDACVPADAPAFESAHLLTARETAATVAAMARDLDAARSAGGRYVARGTNTDPYLSWCMICASEIRPGASVAIISIRA